MSQTQTNNQNPLSASELWNRRCRRPRQNQLPTQTGRQHRYHQLGTRRSHAMQTMFGALRAVKLDLPQPQRSVTTLENPEHFKQEMEEAGFHNIEIRSVTKAFPVGSTAEFWESMVKGSAPIQKMKKGLGEALWREKEKLALDWLEETLPKY